jgi:hypothetical protein
MQFLNTNHGLINERYIVKMFRQEAGSYQSSTYDVIYHDGSGETQKARASQEDVDQLLHGPTMPC